MSLEEQYLSRYHELKVRKLLDIHRRIDNPDSLTSLVEFDVNRTRYLLIKMTVNHNPRFYREYLSVRSRWVNFYRDAYRGLDQETANYIGQKVLIENFNMSRFDLEDILNT